MNVLEGDHIVLSGLLPSHLAKGKSFKLKFWQDDKDYKEATVSFPDDAHGSHSNAPQTIEAPKVPPNQLSSKLTYAIDNSHSALVLTVWPRSAKITVVGPDDQPLKKFAFKVRQHGKDSEAKSADDNGVAEFKLAKGSTFQVVGIAPYVIQKVDDKSPPRDLKIKAAPTYTAIIEAPIVGLDNQLRQFVNLPTAGDGQKGEGSRVTVRVTAKEGAEKAGPLAYVRATFLGPGGQPGLRKESAEDLKPRLLKSKQLDDIKQDTSDAEMKTRFLARLKLPKGHGEFEVELGKAGGDTCLIEVGSTEEFTDDCRVTFENWRKLRYEVLAPQESTLPKGAKGFDFPAETKRELEGHLNPLFLDLELTKSTPFDPAKECREAQPVRASFMDKQGPDGTHMSPEQAIKVLRALKRAEDKSRLLRFIVCEASFRLAEGEPVRLSGTGVEPSFGVQLPSRWLPKSLKDNGPGLRNVRWRALVAPYPRNVAWTASGAQLAGGGQARVIIQETTVGTALALDWAGPVTVGDAEKQRIEDFLRALITPQFCWQTGGGLCFKLQSTPGLDTDAVYDAVEAAFGRLHLPAYPVPNHPGLDNGQPRSGELDLAHDLDERLSTSKKPHFKMPGPVARFAGPNSATHCPIQVSLEYDAHISLLGGQFLPEDLIGDMQVVFTAVGKKACADAIAHEAGHLYGMTPLDAADDKFAPGVKKVKSVADDEGDAFKSNGSKGHYYKDKGGIGEHCAYGLSDAQKATADYSDFRAQAVCTMFQTAPAIDKDRQRVPRFCPQCEALLRARDYSKI